MDLFGLWTMFIKFALLFIRCVIMWKVMLQMSNKFKMFEWNLQYNVLEDSKEVYKIQRNPKKLCKGYMTLEDMRMS